MLAFKRTRTRWVNKINSLSPQKAKFLAIVMALSIIGLFSRSPILAQSFMPSTMQTLSPPIQMLGSLSIGTLTVPYQGDFLPDLRLDLSFSCNHSLFCNRFQVNFLRTYIFLSFANDSFWEDGFGLAAEHHLPFAKIAIEPLDLTFSSRIHLILGRLEIFRALRTLEENMNLQTTLATLRVPFGQVASSYAQGGCFFDTVGPGIKYVNYARDENVSFAGLLIGGLKQGCHFELGSSKIAAEIGYTLRSEVHIGQSGDGSPSHQGGFGAVLSEHRIELHAGLRVSLPQAASQCGIFALHFRGFFEVRYHLDQGCLQNTDSTVPTCSNNTAYYEVRTGFMLSLDFGFPGSIQKTKLPTLSSFSFGL